MFNRIERNRASAAKIALLLDEATMLTDDVTLLTQLAALKDRALSSRCACRRARRSDHRTRREVHRLIEALQNGSEPYRAFPLLREIEQGLFIRESAADSESARLAARKQMLLARCQSQILEIDALAVQCRKIIAEGMSASDTAAQLLRESYQSYSDRMKLAKREFDETLQALRAMDSVLLMRSEEETVTALEREYAHLPDPDALEEDTWRTELRRAQMNERVGAIETLRKKAFDSVEATPDELREQAPSEAAPATQRAKERICEIEF